MSANPFRLPTVWPRPHDAGAAQRLLERFAGLGRSEARLAAHPAVAAMLAAIGGNSPFLTDLAIREAPALRALVTEGPDPIAQRLPAIAVHRGHAPRVELELPARGACLLERRVTTLLPRELDGRRERMKIDRLRDSLRQGAGLG